MSDTRTPLLADGSNSPATELTTQNSAPPSSPPPPSFLSRLNPFKGSTSSAPTVPTVPNTVKTQGNGNHGDIENQNEQPVGSISQEELGGMVIDHEIAMTGLRRRRIIKCPTISCPSITPENKKAFVDAAINFAKSEIAPDLIGFAAALVAVYFVPEIPGLYVVSEALLDNQFLAPFNDTISVLAGSISNRLARPADNFNPGVLTKARFDEAEADKAAKNENSSNAEDQAASEANWNKSLYWPTKVSLGVGAAYGIGLGYRYVANLLGHQPEDAEANTDKGMAATDAAVYGIVVPLAQKGVEKSYVALKGLFGNCYDRYQQHRNAARDADFAILQGQAPSAPGMNPSKSGCNVQ